MSSCIFVILQLQETLDLKFECRDNRIVRVPFKANEFMFLTFVVQVIQQWMLPLYLRTYSSNMTNLKTFVVAFWFLQTEEEIYYFALIL